MLPRLLWRDLHGARCHQNLHERFGYGSAQQMTTHDAQRCLWFHAASVGEVQSLQPIIAALQQCFPQLPVAISAFTPAGKTTAQRICPEAAAIFLLPLDFPGVMRRLVQRLQPQVLIVQETELWPHLLRAVSRQGAPVVVVNGRLSPRAFARYQWGRPLMQCVLSHVSMILAQSADNAKRFQHLGAPSERVRVTGNTNIDRALWATTQPAKPHPLAPLLHKHRIWVAGSTHEGEETTLLNVYRQLQTQHPDLRLVLAPRHLERTTTVVRHVQASGYHAVCRSQYGAQHGQELTASSVLILDTLGELAALYSLCTVAFVGGSLIPVGGHNILEPAVYGKPVIFGPYMHHFPELAAMLCTSGGAVQVKNEADLCRCTAHILAHPEAGRSMGKRALNALAVNQGALRHTTQAIIETLKQNVAHG
jgi:3-deoxy-D-manno-octulosonic-acid transferase